MRPSFNYASRSYGDNEIGPCAPSDAVDAVSELRALEIRLAVVLHNTHANIDQLARHKAMLLAQKKTSPVFKAQKLPKAQEVIESIQSEALALGRDNEQYKARLSQQHKINLMQMNLISQLEALLRVQEREQQLYQQRLRSQGSAHKDEHVKTGNTPGVTERRRSLKISKS